MVDRVLIPGIFDAIVCEVLEMFCRLVSLPSFSAPFVSIPVQDLSLVRNRLCNQDSDGKCDYPGPGPLKQTFQTLTYAGIGPNAPLVKNRRNCNWNMLKRELDASVFSGLIDTVQGAGNLSCLREHKRFSCL